MTKKALMATASVIKPSMIKISNTVSQASVSLLVDTYPSPTRAAANAVHFNDSSSQKPAKRSSCYRCREKDSHTEAAFITSIPQSNIEGDAREESTLCYTQRRSCREQPCEVVNQAHKCAANCPRNHDRGDPN